MPCLRPLLARALAILAAVLVLAPTAAIAQNAPDASPAPPPACATLDPAVDPFAGLAALTDFLPIARAAEPLPEPTTTPDPALATPAPTATPALPAATDRAVRLAAHVLLACAGASDGAAVADRVALPLLQAWYAAGAPVTRAQAVAFVAAAAPVAHRLVALGAATPAADGGVVLETLYLRGNLLVHAAWTFAPAAAPGDGWLLVAEAPLPALAAPLSAIVDATLTDGAIALSTDGVGGPNVVLQVRNDGATAHEALLLEIPWGWWPGQLFTPGGSWPEGVRIAAQVTLAPGASVALPLTALGPAQYAVVCLLPGSDGRTHLAAGEQALLQIW
jgi:hypothetical protein